MSRDKGTLCVAVAFLGWIILGVLIPWAGCAKKAQRDLLKVSAKPRSDAQKCLEGMSLGRTNKEQVPLREGRGRQR